MSEDENTKIQRITEFLEKGGTMLANHHGCGAPMFRYQGKTLCPVCDYQGKQDEKKITIEQERSREKKIMKTASIDYNEIAVLVKNKIHGIAESLENETDLQRVRDKMECIRQGIKILRLLES